MRIGITGSTGHLGNLVIENLLKMGTLPSDITALARAPEKAAALKSKGVDVKIGDYNDPESLEQAFEGIDQLLMISASDVGQRGEQHQNIIEAAKKNGVKHLVYTSIFHADTSVNPLAPEHVQTEKMLKESGLSYTLLRNNWYTENYTDDVARAKDLGFIESIAGDAKVASAPRNDYAEAAAVVLKNKELQGKTYELSGKEWSFYELAETASEVLNRSVEYKPVDEQERRSHLAMAELPPPIIDFVTAIEVSIREGSLEGSTRDLEDILGRKPETIKETLSRLF